jgi:hypothetical protein
MKFDTVEKAKRILPSFVMRLADGISDIHVLRHRIEREHDALTVDLMRKLGETHSGSCVTAEIRELDRRRIQLTNFLELTQNK